MESLRFISIPLEYLYKRLDVFKVSYDLGSTFLVKSVSEQTFLDSLVKVESMVSICADVFKAWFRE